MYTLKNYILFLSGFLKKLPSNIEQNPSNHSYGYALQNICPIFLGSFSRNSTHPMNHSG